MESASFAFATFAPSIPSLLIWILGILIAVIRWQEHPRVSALTSLALGGFIAIQILGVISHLHYVQSSISSGFGKDSQYWFIATQGLLSLFGAGCWGILLLVIFGQRKKK